jgi:hypothetical protein
VFDTRHTGGTGIIRTLFIDKKGHVWEYHINRDIRTVWLGTYITGRRTKKDGTEVTRTFDVEDVTRVREEY